ncbi:metal ABC transporter solute-binding protein, Zn/Mn family [Corynebacterium auris]|uniref:metal ABC transporter solute-binding protein, Zn/Mn family n=1 Tax=Corynebacterium auris TaxID=44750 RepID=UPI0025B47D22|nr:zinc ABC transporter substrate-binding protein [Corynebacterium auris]WJY68772.1 high-affinity zinc transporter periplasmic component [Corynebacterium auris]
MRKFSPTRPFAGVIAAATAAATLMACSPENEQDSAAPAEEQTEDTVATTQVWADVATSVLDREIGAVISNPSIDPHDYEPTAEDHARIQSADLVIANGGSYDVGLYTAAEPGNIISALPLAEDDEHDHDHDHEHDHDHDHDHAHDENEHIWYSTEAVREVGHQIAETAGGDTAELDAQLDAIAADIDDLPAARIAQVHPIADALIEESDLELVTPESYRSATLNHTEPPAAAIAEFLDAIEAGEIDVLVHSPQSVNASARRIIEAAQEHNVPIVEVYETPPNGEEFLDYFARVVDEIGQALQ